MNLSRRSFLAGITKAAAISGLVAAPAIIRTPGLLMPVKAPPIIPSDNTWGAVRNEVLDLAPEVVNLPAGCNAGFEMTIAAGVRPIHVFHGFGLVKLEPGHIGTFIATGGGWASRVRPGPRSSYGRMIATDTGREPDAKPTVMPVAEPLRYFDGLPVTNLRGHNA